MKLDASQILPSLWQGAKPPRGPYLQLKGFTGLVLCASEYQPPAHDFTGVAVVHSPNNDTFDGVSAKQVTDAYRAARETAAMVRAGHRVLVTCWAGINRSGLVTAIALHLLTGRSGMDCIQHIKRCRRRALTNPAFQEVIARLQKRA